MNATQPEQSFEKSRDGGNATNYRSIVNEHSREVDYAGDRSTSNYMGNNAQFNDSMGYSEI